MGIYYNPNPPHIGAQQPLEQRKLTPPSGPLPQNPPFNGGAKIAQAVILGWSALVVTNAIAPITARNFTPPSGPVTATPYNPARYDIYRSWDAPSPRQITAVNLDPPINGPVVNNPPFTGARVPLEVHINWPPPLVIVQYSVNTPIPAPAASVPYIRSNVDILNAWLPPVPAPIVGPNLTSGVPGSTLTLSTTENPDLVSFTATFRDVWVASIKQDETWTPAIKQDETWTPK